MTIAELLERIGELLGRIPLAFERTFNLVREGKLGDLVLSDLATVAVVGGLGLVVGIMALAWVIAVIVELFDPRTLPPRDDD